MTIFKQALLCLLWLWLPFAGAADGGWLRVPDNPHAGVRFRTAPQDNGDVQ